MDGVGGVFRGRLSTFSTHIIVTFDNETSLWHPHATAAAAAVVNQGLVKLKRGN